MTDASGAVLRGAVDLSSLRNRPAPGAAGAPAGGQTEVSSVMTITDADFPQLLELSRSVPVVVELTDRMGAANPALQQLVVELGGRVVLAKVDIDANPQIGQAFRPQGTPMGVALIAGQPVPLFAGPVTDDQLRELFGQLLQLAAQNGVTGTVPVGDVPETPDTDADVEPPLPPLHAEAFAAIEQGDYARAVTAYEQALAENPRDEEARAGLGQVKLLQRVQGADLQAARDAAAAAPTDIDAQFEVADLDIAGGHVDDAFERLLDLFSALPSDERGPVRERLLELFGLVGDADPRTGRARARLSSMLF